MSIINVPGERHFERIYEDGVPLGPELKAREAVGAQGTWAQVPHVNTEGGDRSTILVFVSSDGSSPKTNRRRYEAQYALRDDPRASGALLLTWLLLPAAAFASWRAAGRGPLGAGMALATSAWSVLTATAFYSLFALQASLSSARSLPWLIGLIALALPLLPSTKRTHSACRTVWIWLTGVLIWCWATLALPGLQGAPADALHLTMGCLLGVVLIAGFAGRLGSRGTAPAALLLIIWGGVSVVLILDTGGMDLLAALTAYGLVPFQASDVWIAKFSRHWLVVLTWCVLLAVSAEHRMPRVETGVLIAGTLIALLSGGSKTATFAFLCGLGVAAPAMAWPRLTRRSLVTGTVLLLLLAPALYRLPWQIHGRLSPDIAATTSRYLETSVRGGVWESTARLVAVRPWTGWGIGASSRLPAASTSLAELLQIPSAERTPGQLSHTGLPGGHPHSLPLLLWLDLGLVGAALVSGLVLAVGRLLARFETDRASHAFLLALFASTVAMFAVNYPAWHPVVLSMLWMGPALAASLLTSSASEPTSHPKTGGSR